MKSTLVVLVALSGWTATALPIHWYNNHDQAADVSATAATPFHTSYDHAGPFPVRTESSSSSADTPHFLDWLAKVPPAQRDTLFHAAEAHRGNWIDRARKMANTWSTFYGTEYPTKPKPPPPQSFDSGNDNSLQDEAFITLSDDTCGFIVENSSDGGDDTRTTTMLTIPCPSTTLPSHSRPRRPSYFEQLRRHLATMDVAMLCSRYGPELVALCIFLLVPISIVLVEIVDLVHDRMVTEKFPERGRGRVRLTGPERRLSVLAKCERERIVRDQALKSWVNSRRGSRHAAD